MRLFHIKGLIRLEYAKGQGGPGSRIILYKDIMKTNRRNFMKLIGMAAVAPTSLLKSKSLFRGPLSLLNVGVDVGCGDSYGILMFHQNAAVQLLNLNVIAKSRQNPMTATQIMILQREHFAKYGKMMAEFEEAHRESIKKIYRGIIGMSPPDIKGGWFSFEGMRNGKKNQEENQKESGQEEGGQ